MKGLITILILMLAASVPAAANCACSLGGGASYNFLGDPAVDVNMESYDEFVRENVQTSSVTVPNVQTALQSRMNLDLNDKSSIDLELLQAEGSLSGQGNMTGASGTVPVGARGRLLGNTLTLDVTASGGELLRFNLASEGSTVMGDYSETLPDGKNLTGTAEGKWRSV